MRKFNLYHFNHKTGNLKRVDKHYPLLLTLVMNNIELIKDNKRDLSLPTEEWHTLLKSMNKPIDTDKIIITTIDSKKVVIFSEHVETKADEKIHNEEDKSPSDESRKDEQDIVDNKTDDVVRSGYVDSRDINGELELSNSEGVESEEQDDNSPESTQGQED